LQENSGSSIAAQLLRAHLHYNQTKQQSLKRRTMAAIVFAAIVFLYLLREPLKRLT
jgi:hypothetical protein